MSNVATTSTDTKSEMFLSLSELAELVPEMPAGQFAHLSEATGLFGSSSARTRNVMRCWHAYEPAGHGCGIRLA